MADRMQAWTAAMRSGEFEAAWALAQQMLLERDPATRDDSRLPYHLRWVWDGRDFDGRHVLVRCYHGLGDTIQFARYLPALARRAASLTVEVQPRLIDLLSRMPGPIQLVPFDPACPLPPSECDLEITELDFALRLPPDQAPPPYLGASPAILPKGTIGLCHGAGEWDRARCVPPELFAPLCRRAPCITLMPERCPFPVLNRDGCPFDMGVTASLVAGAALIVTVDTMIAHLAGAMGRPVWLLLKAEPDWRWPIDGRGSIWYPSVRLYVQPRPGDWLPVLAEVERDLVLRNRGIAER